MTTVVADASRPVVVRVGLATAAVAACAALALPADPAEYGFWRDTVAHDVPFLLAAPALLLAPVADPVRRRAWRLLGVGCGLALLGNVYITLRPQTPLPADRCWLIGAA